MASSANLLIRVLADTDKAVRQLGQVERQVKSLDRVASGTARAVGRAVSAPYDLGMAATRALTSGGRALQSFGSNATSAGMGITALTAPVVGLGAFALKAAMDNEAAWADVEKTVEGTPAQLAALNDQLTQMARQKPIPLTELFGIAAMGGALGVPTAALGKFTGVVADLTNTTDLSAEAAADWLARFSNITGMPWDDVDRGSSTMVHLGNTTAATESEIAEWSLRIAGAATTAGFLEHQMIALAAAGASVGLNAEAGGTAFSRIINDMTKSVVSGSDELAVFAATAGVTIDEFKNMAPAERFLKFIQGIGKVQAGGGDPFQVLKALGLDDIRVTDAVLRMAAAETQQGLLTNALREGATAWQQNTALQDEAARRYATNAAQLEMFKNRVLELAVNLGAALMPVMQAILAVATTYLPVFQGLIDRFVALPAPVKALAITLGLVAAVAGPLLIFLGLVAQGLGSLLVIVGGAGQILVGGLLGPLKIVGAALLGLSPILLLVVGAVALFAVAFATNFLGIRDAVLRVLPEVGRGLQALASIFAQGLGIVFQIVVTIGLMIYEALQYLNPFARHSAPLVDQVDDGVGQMAASYNQLAAAEAPIDGVASSINGLTDAQSGAASSAEAMKAQQKGLQDAIEATRDRISGLKDQLNAARADLDRFANAALVGERAMSDAIFGKDMAIAELELREMEIKLGGGRGKRKELRQIAKDLERARLERDILAKKQFLEFAPQHRALEQMADQTKEMTFAEAAKGIQDSLAKIAAIEPILAREEESLKGMEDAAKALADAIGGLSGAAGALGALPEDIAAAIGELEQFDLSALGLGAGATGPGGRSMKPPSVGELSTPLDWMKADMAATMAELQKSLDPQAWLDKIQSLDVNAFFAGLFGPDGMAFLRDMTTGLAADFEIGRQAVRDWAAELGLATGGAADATPPWLGGGGAGGAGGFDLLGGVTGTLTAAFNTARQAVLDWAAALKGPKESSGQGGGFLGIDFSWAGLMRTLPQVEADIFGFFFRIGQGVPGAIVSGLTATDWGTLGPAVTFGINKGFGPGILGAFGPGGYLLPLIVAGIAGFASGVVAGFAELVNKVAKDVEEKFGVLGEAAIQGLKTGWNAAFPFFNLALIDAIGKIVALAKKLLGIGSPSTVFRAIGVDLVLGLAEGVLSILPQKLAEIATAIATWIATTAAAVLTDAATIGANFVAGVKAGAADLATTLAGLASQVIAWIGATATLMLTEAQKIGANILAGIKTGLQNGLGSLTLPGLPQIQLPSIGGPTTPAKPTPTQRGGVPAPGDRDFQAAAAAMHGTGRGAAAAPARQVNVTIEPGAVVTSGARPEFARMIGEAISDLVNTMAAAEEKAALSAPVTAPGAL